MAYHSTPVDAHAAKNLLRAYAIASPAAALLGGWCTLLQIVWLAFPDAVVDHMPAGVRIAAAAGALLWFYWLYRTFRRLPALIDEILARGLSLSPSNSSNIDHWRGRPVLDRRERET
jgi:hypothetical protein